MAVLLLAFWMVQEDPTSLVEQLNSDKIEERAEAEEKLKAMGERARTALEKGAKSASPEVVSRAGYFLRVLDLRRDLSDKLQKAIVGVAERLAQGEWVDVFLEGVKIEGLEATDLEKVALEALERAKESGKILPVISGIEKVKVRAAAPQLVKLLGEKLPGHESLLVASFVQRALATLGAKEVVADLMNLLKDKNVHTSRAAAETLGKLRAKEVIPDLLKLLKDEDPHVRTVAAGVLKELEAKEAVPDLVLLLKDGDAGPRMAAASALGELGAKEAVPDLIKLTKDEDEYVRVNAAQSLGKLGAKEAVPDLVTLLEDEKEFVRSMAVFALGELGAKEAVPNLVKLLKDQN